MLIRLFEENFGKISEFHRRNMFLTYFCTDSSSLVKVPHDIALVNVSTLYAALERFIICNSDDGVQTLISTGNSSFLLLTMLYA